MPTSLPTASATAGISPKAHKPLARLLVLVGLGLMVGSASQARPAQASAALEVQATTPVEARTGSVDWELDGPFALRHMTVVLSNPSQLTLEATLRVPLGSQEVLRGFALDVNGRLTDAVPVERVKARVAFESTVRQAIDPALVERDEGNSYRVRVFPVPAMGQRTVRITVASLAKRAPCGWAHQLTLPRGRYDGFSLLVKARTAEAPQATGPWRSTTTANGETIWSVAARTDRNIPGTVCLPAPNGVTQLTQTLDDGTRMNWMEWPVSGKTVRRAVPAHLEVVWDASLSHSATRAAEAQVLTDYLRALGPALQRVTVTVLRHRLSRHTVALSGDDGAGIDQLVAMLLALPADGATALRSWRPAPGAQAVLMFSDGANSWPSAEPLASTDMPVHVVANGVTHPAAAQALARHSGSVLDLTQFSTAQAVERLLNAPQWQLALGPQDLGWYAPGQAPVDGVVRACHISETNSPESAGGAAQLRLPALMHTPKGTQRRLGHTAADGGRPSSQLGFWCGQWWMQSLEADPDRHRTQLATVGQRFGLAGPETSLLVLESAADYVRHGIDPPGSVSPEIKVAVLQGRELQAQAAERLRTEHLQTVTKAWQSRAQWWEATFPKGTPALPEGGRLPKPVPAPSAPMPARAMEAARAMAASSAMEAARASPPPTSAPTGPIGIQLQRVTVQTPYAAQLMTATGADAAYQRYLDLRHAYRQSPAFYVDVAERLFELGDPERAVQVLSNVVELMPREAVALRPVAYRLQQAKLDDLALDLLRRTAQLAPDEPTSDRDYGLALARKGDCAAALQHLSRVVLTRWDLRFRDVAVTTLADLHDQAVACPGMDLTRFPEALRRPLPVGLRVVLKWNLNDTDIDLHVKDPNGETANYRNRNTYQGGRMSADFVAGYGPEEFVLKEPKPGVYEVSVHYFGSRMVTVSRGAVLQVELQSHFGTAARQTAPLTMRLIEQSGMVLVGRFTVGEGGTLQPAP